MKHFRHYSSYILYIFITIGIFSCQKDNSNNPSENNNPPIPIDEIIPDSTENYVNLKSDYLFDQERLHTFELNLPQENLDFINASPADEIYTEGSLTFEGEQISTVGIRYKGSIGGFVNCLSGNDWANPTGHKTCTKLSMKVKINWGDPDKKFYGVKKLQFHSMNLDPTQMHDRLGYHLFREMGVPAPRSTHCRLVINGEYSGVYALVENLDGRFVKQNFDNDEGNLYKEIWPIDSDGNPHSISKYQATLKTNEEASDVSIMQAFADEIKNASESEMLQIVNKWMYPEEIISYAVVDRLIKNDDGAFHWYCGSGSCSPHNFYWYEDDVDKKMHLIPWDLDNAFENIFNGNPVTNIPDEWGETRNDCEPFKNGLFGFSQKSAACDKLTKAWTMLEDLYDNQKQVFINGPYSEASVNSLLDKWVDQIRDATIEANEMHGDALNIAVWDHEVEQLKEAVAVMRGE